MEDTNWQALATRSNGIALPYPLWWGIKFTIRTHILLDVARQCAGLAGSVSVGSVRVIRTLSTRFLSMSITSKRKFAYSK